MPINRVPPAREVCMRPAKLSYLSMHAAPAWPKSHQRCQGLCHGQCETMVAATLFSMTPHMAHELQPLASCVA